MTKKFSTKLWNVTFMHITLISIVVFGGLPKREGNQKVMSLLQPFQMFLTSNGQIGRTPDWKSGKSSLKPPCLLRLHSDILLTVTLFKSKKGSPCTENPGYSDIPLTVTLFGRPNNSTVSGEACTRHGLSSVKTTIYPK